MRNFHIKSILLGIGIGIVLTSIISIIYTTGINTKKEMTREEIIAKAVEFGMVDGTPLISSDQKDSKVENKAKGDNANDGSQQAGTDQIQKDTSTDPQKDSDKKSADIPVIDIEVRSGDTSEIVAEKLLHSGLIKDKDAFIDTLRSMGLETEINVGKFKVNKGTGPKEIIRLITSRA